MKKIIKNLFIRLIYLIAILNSSNLLSDEKTNNSETTKKQCEKIEFLNREIFSISASTTNSDRFIFIATDKNYDHVFSICLEIKNLSDTSQNITVQLDNPRIRHAELINVSGDTKTPLAVSGLEYPLKNWKRFGSEIIFNIDIPPGENQKIELNIGSIFPYNSQIQISDSETAFNILTKQKMATGLLCGIIFSLVFYSAFLGISAKDKTYLFLFGSTSCVTLLQLNDMGELYFLWPDSIYWNNVSSGIFAIISTFCGVGLARSYLITKGTNPKFDRILAIYFWYMAIIALPLPLFENDSLFLTFFAMPTVIIVLPSLVIISIIRIRQHYTPAKLYLLALAMPIIAGLIIFLMYIGTIPSSPMARVLPLTGTALQLILFAIALGERINWLKEQQFTSSQQTLLFNTETNAKKNFLAHISHELRTPLAGIIGLADLARKNPLYSTNKVLIDGINESASHLLETTNTLLDHARLDAGKWIISNEIFNTNQIIKSLSEKHNPSASRKNITLSIKKDKKIPEFLYGDKNIIERIVDIIIENSISHTKNGCILVNIDTTTNKHHKMFIRFDIVDTGNSVDESYRPRIFEIFELADTSTTREQQGLGLGLSLSKKFCDFLGGEIGYESSPQHGTAFWCMLPCQLPPDQSIQTPPSTEAMAEPEDPTKKRILIAEDDETLQLIIKSQMDKLKINSTIFPNGKPLVEEYEKCHPEVGMVLLDWNMPICNASAAIAAIREYEMNKRLPPVTIAVLSAYDKNSAKDMQLPEDIKLLQKPVTTANLIKLFSSSQKL